MRGAHGPAACSTAVALLKLVLSCLRARGSVTLDRRSFAAAAPFRGLVRRTQRLAPLRLVVGTVASSQGAVAVAQRPWRRCLRHRTDTPCAGSVVPLRSRRRGAWPPTFLWRRLTLPARCVVLSGVRFLRVVVGVVAFTLEAVAVARHSRRRGLQYRAGAFGAGLVVPPRLRQRDARPPLLCCSGLALA